MDIGIFVNTPAHAHLYRECVKELHRRGHTVEVFARDDSCTLDILDYHGIEFHVYGRRSGGTARLLWDLRGQLRTIKRLVRGMDLDLVIGMGVYSTYAAVRGGIPALTVMDSEPMATIQRATGPVVAAFLTPDSFKRDLGRKHFVFHGFKETAYLHPDVFTPGGSIREELDLASDEPFSLVRFNGFHAHHDVGHHGFTPDQKRQIVATLAEFGTVFVSEEQERGILDGTAARPYDAHPALIHDAIAEAQLMIADTQTMVTEAALLGTPAIRSNSFVGASDMGNFESLERAGLVFNLDRFEAVLATTRRLLERDDLEAEWERRRRAFLADKCNLTAMLVDLVEDAAVRGSIRAAVDRHPTLHPGRAGV